MAVTLPTEANEISTLSSAYYEILNSDAGVAPIQKFAGYQVLDGSSNPLTSIHRVPNGVTNPFDIAKHLKSIVSTPFPGVDTQNSVAVSEYSSAYSISYGEITFDPDNLPHTANLLSTTTGKKVVNAYLKSFEDADHYNSGDLVILSDKPSQVYIGNDQPDYLYFYRKTGSVYILLDIKYTDGTSGGASTDIALNGNAGYISCGTSNLFQTPAKPVSSYTIEVYDDVGLTNLIKSYSFIKESVCSNSLSSLVLYFLNDRGGWEAIECENLGSGASRNSSLGISPVPSNTANRHQAGGLTAFDQRSQVQFNLGRIYTASNEAHAYFASVISGRDFYLKYYNGKEFIAQKCVVSNGTFNPVNDREVRFQLSVTLNRPF